jgi:hypothetical protein
MTTTSPGSPSTPAYMAIHLHLHLHLHLRHRCKVREMCCEVPLVFTTCLYLKYQVMSNYIGHPGLGCVKVGDLYELGPAQTKTD